MKSIANNKPSIFAIFLIILLSIIVTLGNLGWQKNFIGEDSGVNYNFPRTLFPSVYYTWNALRAPGQINTTLGVSFLWANFTLILFKLGVNSILIKRLVYFLFFVTSGSGAFFFLTLLTKIYANLKNKNLTSFGAFCGSLLYMLNHFTMQMASFPIIPYHLSYMLFPWVLTLFIYNLQVKTSFARSFLFALIFLFLLNGNPSNSLSIILFLLFYLIFFRKEVKKGPSKPWRFLVTSFILILFLSAYIFLPILGGRETPYTAAGLLEDWLVSLHLHSFLTSFLNLIQLAGAVNWHEYPYYQLYTTNPIFIFLSLLMPILAITSLLMPKVRKVKSFFASIIVLSLFFAKGAHPPLEKLFLFFYRHLPYAGIFRAAYYKFTYFAVLSYAVLISFFLSQSLVFFKKHTRPLKYFQYFILIPPLIIGLYAWPFFTGSVVKKDFLTLIPKEYQQISKTPEGDYSLFNILSSPPSPRGRGLLLQWPDDNKYVGPHPDARFLNKPVLNAYWFIENGFNDLGESDSWFGTRFESSFDLVLKFAPILNFKYIFLHKDFVSQYDFGAGPIQIDGPLKAKTLESILEKQAGIEVVKNTDYFTLYKLADKYFLPHFYIPEKLTYINNDIKTLFDKFSFGDYPTRPGIYSGKTNVTDGEILEGTGEIFLKASEKKFTLEKLEYQLEIPIEGEYQVYIGKIPVEELKNLKIKLNEKVIDFGKIQPKTDDWLALGNKIFTIGNHSLTFELPEPENLIEDNWQKPAKIPADVQEIVFQEINNWQEGSLYYLSFDYKIESGSLGVQILESTDYLEKKETAIFTKLFKKEKKSWQRFEQVLNTSENSLGAKIYFYSLPESRQLAKVAFENLRVYKIIHPKIVIRNTNLQNDRTNSPIPKITFVKINPVKYKVKVEGVKEPYTLVFSEGFDKGWKAYVKNYELGSMNYESDGEIMASYFDGEIKEGEHKNIFFDKNTFETLGKKTIPEERHLLINGYANAWEIKPEDSNHQESYELIIEFLPQRFFYLGLFISGIAFIGSSLYSLYQVLWRKYHE